MKDKTILAIVGIVCVTWLETLNLMFFKLDGVILTGIIAVISGLAGYKLKKD